MNPVLTYDDFINYLRNSPNNKERDIPVLLIKPHTVIELNRESRLEHIFNYYDSRTGKWVDFFLPGYAHYPFLPFPKSVSYSPYDTSAVAMNLDRLGKIYYSNNSFVSFVELVEDKDRSFHYCGHTELVFFRYLPGDDYSPGTFSFPCIGRYDLTNLYLKSGNNYYSVEHFLEQVIHTIKESSSGMGFKRIIDGFYLG